MEPIFGKFNPNVVVFLVLKGLKLQRIFYDLRRHRVIKKEERDLIDYLIKMPVRLNSLKVAKNLGSSLDVLTGELGLIIFNSNP